MGASFMQTILIPIQSELPRLLSASSEDTPWVITATLISAAICTPIAGRLGDMYGKRRVVMALLLIQALGAIIAALSVALVPMLVARILQGASAGVIPLGISILRDVLPSKRLGSAIALISATLGVGGALGLPISAAVTEAFDWHVLFWVAAGIALLNFILCALVVPVSVLRTQGRLDVIGIIGLSLGLVSLLVAITRGGSWGWGDPRIIGLLLGGLVVLFAWGAYELRVREPLVDLRVSSRGPVLLTNLASIAMGFALFASSVVFPQLLELPVATGIGLGLSLFVAALVLAPSGIAMMLMSPVAGRIQRLRGPKPLLIAGAGVIAISYVVGLLFHASMWQILVVNFILGIGVGLGYAAMPTLIMRAVPAEETGAANGLNALMRSLGTSAAAAVVGALLAQSITTVNGVVGPSEQGFLGALTLGLIAAILCLVLALFIPEPKVTEHPSLPRRSA
ncbi:MFS transporter [Amnibacterium flavum]|uniref:MFS transporter n=2 Tax=Amnibacterium flavum TaxID=2173173 RepID=A0A2V1HLM6_9MICO|nr:MFS transporter [Amnibacterium flavum]